VTREQIVAAAAEIVERSTRAQGLPLHLEDEATLDQLAAAVADTMAATDQQGGDGHGEAA
jgi:hypothetical protein